MSAPGASGGARDDGRRVPYRRWRRWVRSLRRRAALVRVAEGGGDPNDRVYLAYGVVLLGLVYGPILWSAVAQAGTALGASVPHAAGDGLLAAGALLALGLLSVAALVVARAGGPLWVSPVEATFALSGQFAPRDVLWRRGVALVVGAAAVGAFGVTALARGAGTDPVEILLWGLCGATLAQLPIAVGVAAQVPRWRSAAWTVTGLLLSLGAVAAATLTASEGLEVGPGTGPMVALLVGTAAVAGGCLALVLRVLPDRVDVDAAAAGHRRALAAGRGLAGGDSAAVADVLGPGRSPAAAPPSRRGCCAGPRSWRATCWACAAGPVPSGARWRPASPGRASCCGGRAAPRWAGR